MATLKYTALRHRILAEADAERFMRVWVDMAGTRTAWRRRPGEALSATEARALGEVDREGLLYVHSRLGPSVRAPKRVELSRAGAALLVEWNAKHGNPLTEESE